MREKKVKFSDDELVIMIEHDIDTYFSALISVSPQSQHARLRGERNHALKIKDSFLLFLYKN